MTKHFLSICWHLAEPIALPLAQRHPASFPLEGSYYQGGTPTLTASPARRMEAVFSPIFWQNATVLPVPLAPIIPHTHTHKHTKCHHRIAGKRYPLAPASRLCPRKQTAISRKSSEVSTLVSARLVPPSNHFVWLPGGWHRARQLAPPPWGNVEGVVRRGGEGGGPDTHGVPVPVTNGR
ncbi:hypothetical protein NHX12_003048 [Muraenolepis orangiensis]|uniref:Uncharacterized protein n=1 Tax=Muraenolepis orangiensis TaxID=630683 RepID=A0A9Q0DVP6_9TELE|nr:hypothetical protein NHX12_003048 [Muraenolepis orangiensis]